MIGYIEGTIILKTNQTVIVDTGGVGYTVAIPPKLLAATQTGQKIRLFVHTHVTDDAITLFGLSLHEELIFFELLLTVSGIGPKTAVLVIDHGVSAIHAAVTNADVDFFTSIPRLGTKNAQKIIIELKNKLGSLKELDLSGKQIENVSEVTQALLSMGFDKKEVTRVTRELTHEFDTVEKQLRQALKLLAK